MTLRLNGSTSGYTEIDAPAVAGSNTIVLPSGNGSANQLLKNGSIAGSLEFSSSVYIDSSQRLLVGTSTARSNVQFAGSSYTPATQFETAVAGYDNGLSLINNSTGGHPSNIWIGATKGSAIGSNTLVSSQTLGNINFVGGDGSNLIHGARIHADTDGTTGSGDLPTRLVFSTTADGASTPTERMRIRNNGDIDFNGGVAAGWTTSSGGLRIGASATYGVELSNSRPSSGTATQNFLANYHNGTYIGGINTSTTATSFPTSSDYRLKENVAPISEAVARLQALKPCEFNFKSEPAQRITGFLAHEVQEVLPNAVDGEKDAVDPNGSIKTQCLDHSKLVPLLTAALQEAIAEIASLKDRVAALEGA